MDARRVRGGRGRWWAGASIAERALAVALGLVLVASAAARLGVAGRPRPLDLLSVLCILGFGTAATACLRLAARTDAGRAWAVQGLGLASWLCAEVYAQANRHVLPLPSIADALWLTFYLATYASIVLHARSRLRAHRSLAWIDGLIAGLVAASVVAGLAFRPLLTLSEGRASVVLIALAYPVADLALLVLLVVTVHVAPPRTASPLLQFLGLAAFLVADTTFLLGQVHGTWQAGSSFELLWILGIVLIGLSALTWSPPVREAPREPTLVVPLTSAVAVTALLLYGQIAPLPLAALGLAGAAIGLAVFRLATISGEIRRSARAERQLRTDPLTELPTRTAFTERLDAHLAGCEPRALVLVIDIDDFDDINRSLGREAGDRVLRTVAERLAGLLEPGWFPARIGGDAFALAAPAPEAIEACQLATRVRRVMLEPTNVAGIPLAVSTTVGIASAPEHGSTAAQLLGSADLAVRQGQRSSTRVTVYRPTASDPSAGRFALRSELRAAIELGQIEAHFQPQVDLRTRRPVGAEALARWIHPTLGTISPATFMPIAVESGLLPDLTRSMVLQVERARRLCAEAGHGLDVSLNVSALDLADDDVVACIERAVIRTKDLAGRMVLELTEDAVMVDRVRAAEVLARLRGLGARTSVDDYGTGNASLAYLRDLPLDEVKIDRSFVHGGPADGRSAALTRSTIALAHELGLNTVAEGIEEPAIDDWLVGLGCDIGQGFLYARPMALRSLLDWLDCPLTRADLRRPPETGIAVEPASSPTTTTAVDGSGPYATRD